MFDLDAYCAETATAWAWRGAVTAPFDPDRVMLRLALDGSDRCRHVEFDCAARTFVVGGFDLAPERGSLAWLDADTLLWATSRLPGAATRAGWPGEVRRLSRGMAPEDAPVVFRAESDDLTVAPYVLDYPGRAPLACLSRYREIGQEEVTLLGPDGVPGRVLPSPPDTTVAHNATHMAYVVQRRAGRPGALMLAPLDGAEPREVFSPVERAAVKPFSPMLLRDWLVWIETHDLAPRVMALALGDPDAAPREIALPEPAETVRIAFHDADGPSGDETLQLRLEGYLASPRTYLFDLAAGPGAIVWRRLWREPEAFDPAGMSVRLVEAVAGDGTRVPYHLVLPQGHGTGADDLPVRLYGYGGFAIADRPTYAPALGALWLARGGAFALAHICGGAAFGPEWHVAAKRENRSRAFEDFAAIAADLVARGVTRPDRIACEGRSNGRLLCGVMLTRYPERFGAVRASVGVLDMARFHCFSAGRGWIDEYGDPDDPQALAWLLAYSPLHNVAPAAERRLPPALIDTSAADDRVDPSHARRFAAALCAAGHNDVLFHEAEGGHGGGEASDVRAREIALGLAFLRRALGLADRRGSAPSSG